MSASTKRCAKRLESNIKIKLFNEIKAKLLRRLELREHFVAPLSFLNLCFHLSMLLSSAKTFRVSYKKPNENKLIKIKLSTQALLTEKIRRELATYLQKCTRNWAWLDGFQSNKCF